MIYFNKNGDVYAYTDEQISHGFADGLLKLADDEILKHETPKPTEFHTVWDGINNVWLDSRSLEQIAEHERSLLPPLTKRQFSLYLYDIGKYDQVMDALNANPRFKIEFDTVATIERSSSTVSAMVQILEWDDLTINEKWKEALKL